jgi:predicted ArsR family transcriptional regulator
MEQLGPTGAHRDALLAQARACGRPVAATGSTRDLLERLAAIGYEPVRQPDGTVQMRNCPFHAVVEVARDTTCAMNLELLAALTEGQGRRYRADLEPAEGRCCVLLHPLDP